MAEGCVWGKGEVIEEEGLGGLFGSFAKTIE